MNFLSCWSEIFDSTLYMYNAVALNERRIVFRLVEEIFHGGGGGGEVRK